MALAKLDRAIAAGVRFGCVLADAGYGLSAPFNDKAYLCRGPSGLSRDYVSARPYCRACPHTAMLRLCSFR